MKLAGTNVSHLETDAIMQLMASNSFPSPFKEKPDFSWILNSSPLKQPSQINDILNILNNDSTELDKNSLKQILEIKAELSKELKNEEKLLFEKIKKRVPIDLDLKDFFRYLIYINRKLADHYTDTGSKELADIYHLEIINLQTAYHNKRHYTTLYNPDNKAHIIAQGERGILKNEPVGTSKIMDCLAIKVEASDKTLQLIHMDHYINIPKTFENIRSEMPGPYNLSLIGGMILPSYGRNSDLVNEFTIENARYLIESIKHQPDINISSAWILKGPFNHVGSVVLEPNGNLKVATPNNNDCNIHLEEILAIAKKDNRDFSAFLRMDMRASPVRKPIFLSNYQIKHHYNNLSKFKQNFPGYASDLIVNDPQYFDAHIRTNSSVHLLERSHNFSVSTLSEALTKHLKPIIDSCTCITINGKQVENSTALNAALEKTKEMPKFVGRWQKKLNNQLVKDLILNQNLFEKDGNRNLDIKLDKLYEVAEAICTKIQTNFVTHGHKITR